MQDLLRSDDMALCQMFIPIEAAYHVIFELGELGLVQFKDLNEDVHLLQRNFAKDLLKGYDMERKLKSITNEVKINEVNIYTSPNTLNSRIYPNEIKNLDEQIEKAQEQIEEMKKNSERLKSYSIQLLEFKHVIQKTEEFLKQRDEIFGLSSSHYLADEDFLNVPGFDKLNFFTGVIDTERAATFEKLVFRISNGNAFIKKETIREPIIDVYRGTKQYKSVFVIFCHGDKLMMKLFKLCQGFRASLYTCPSSEHEREKVVENIDAKLNDLGLIINQTDTQRRKFLISVANQLQQWCVNVKKIKAVYHTLNYLNMDVTGKCLIGECWVPVRDIPKIQQAMADASSSSCSVSSFLYVLETDETPPTFNRTNKYTSGFQNLIEVYGTATYKEANPTMYLIVTFPFLFAIMFGDVGHAIVMTIFGLYMVSIEKAQTVKSMKSEIFRIFFGGRYLILLMGIFSIYTGIIYNDIFSKSANIFGSSWFADFKAAEVVNKTDIQLHPGMQYKGVPYPVGIDPIWTVAHNRIILLNSYKMKMSIIIGVAHMILGLCIGIINYRYFEEFHEFFLEFLPRLLLLCCLFLWMVIMMFIKWSLYSADNTDVRFGTSCAPSILVNFIDMMLFKKSHPHAPDCNSYLFEHQDTVQKILICIAALTIPVMLFSKPVRLLLKKKKSVNLENKPNEAPKENVTETKENVNDNEDNATEISPSDGHEVDVKIESSELDENLDVKPNKSSEASIGSNRSLNKSTKEESQNIGEVLVMQAIDTIEYALGTVSHTASYLRLWALSLAHNELSEVLWDRLLIIGLDVEAFYGCFVMFVIFFIWMVFTVLILILMEGLSVFLHTLRLHWVEFMSKFYMGTGSPFLPLCFRTILDNELTLD